MTKISLLYCLWISTEIYCFVFRDAEKPPTSFYIIRVTSKLPCVVIHVAFLNGTPGYLRYKVIHQSKLRF